MTRERTGDPDFVPAAEWERRRGAGVCVDCAGPLPSGGLRCGECLAGIARQKTAWRRWGTAVSELLRERGWTQKQLAAAARVSPDALALAVRHGCELDTRAVRRIADALQIVDVDDLFLTPVQRRACDARKRQRDRDNQRAKRAQRRAEGVCIDCTGPLPGGGSRCKDCRVKAARQMAGWRQCHRERGRCPTCGGRLDDLRWKRCSDCRAKGAATERARVARLRSDR